MKKFSFSILTITILSFLLIYSCSTEEENTTPSPSVIQTPEPEPEPETPAVTQYTLTVTAGDGGSVTDGGTFEDGTSVSVTATPEEGYEFVGWEGNDSTNESLTITINSNQNILATFEQLNAIYLDENGVTVKSYDFAVVGEVYELGVDSYTVVDNELLISMLSNGDDLAKVVTTKVNNKLY